MYPQRELIRLALHKAVVRRRIARQRADLVEAADCIAQPLEWLDHALSLWRRISPIALLAAVPLGWLIKRTGSPRLKLIGALVKWAPMIAGVARGVNAAFKSRA